MTIRIAYTFDRDGFDAIRRLIPQQAWPDTFEEWSEQVRQTVEKHLANGDVVEVATINPEEFTAYRLAGGVDDMEMALNAFAVVTARKQREGRA